MSPTEVSFLHFQILHAASVSVLNFRIGTGQREDLLLLSPVQRHADTAGTAGTHSPSRTLGTCMCPHRTAEQVAGAGMIL